MKLRKLAYILSIVALLGNSVPVYGAEADSGKENAVEAAADTSDDASIGSENGSKADSGSSSASASNDSPEDTSNDSASGASDTSDGGSGDSPEKAPEETAPLAITSFKELSAETAAVSYDDKPALDAVTAALPKTLSVYMNESDEAVEVPVTWECGDDYENTDFDQYEFTPVWDEAEYPLASAQEPDAAAPHAEVPYITVNVHSAKAAVFLMDLEKAKSDLAAVVASKDVLALVYLCDSYTVKQEPDKAASDVAAVASGQSVQITGIGEDNSKNIWYKVSFDLQGSSYNGYIERDYLAFSDEALISFEQKYVSSYIYRTASYASRSMDEKGAHADISKFPSSYQSALTALKKAHPNWIFVKMDTGLDWSSAVASENSKERSLIHSSVNAAWKEGSYDSSWSYPTNGILAYYMDPRNFLSDNYIFQFELLSYNATYHTETAVQGILDGTFMSGAIPGDSRTYAQAFSKIGSSMNVSPFHLASRVRQEQGAGKSPLISGNYSGYEGLYNYFNIGATGKGDKEVIENGLSYAKSQGWTNRYLSLEGGSNIISRNYIQKSQDTLYLQKYNVDKNSPSGLYNHQYMQNIAAPSSEASNVRKAYAAAGAIDKPFVFRIPVYDNMPYTPCVQPSKVKEVTLSDTALTLKADGSAMLIPYVDGSKVSASSVAFQSDNPKVAVVDAGGKVTAVSSGTASITCSMSGASTAVCTVTVEKLKPAYTVPALGGITYSPAQTLSKITLPSGWTWDKPDTVPIVNNAGYPATYTPSDTGKYDTAKEILPLKVAKGTPAYTQPTGLKTAVGNTLGSIRLPAGFSWEQPATVLNKEGAVTCNASYNPDAANYNTVSGIALSVTVTAKSTDCAAHSFGEWEIITAAACKAEGKSARSCLLCGYQETKTTPASGHAYTSAVTKEPSETEKGIRTYTCSKCKDTYTEDIDKLPPSHKHSYTSAVTKTASCTQKGTLTYSCSCGDTYTEDIPAAGHSYSSKVTKEATETETGIRTYTCSKCNDSYTETIAKLPSSHKHSYSSKTTKAPSCTEKGIKTYTCSCGDTYTEEIAATGHSYSSKITKEPDCTNKGIKTYTCSCGSTYTEEISALGHDISDGKCKRCGYKESSGSSGNGSGGSSSGSGSGSSSADGNKPTDTTTAVTSTAPADGSGNSTGTGSSSPIGGTASPSAKPAGTQTDKPDDDSGIVTIDMKKNTVLYEEALSSIRGQDIDVVLSMGNSISWTINGRNIVADEANGIDMGIEINTGNIPSDLLTQAAGGDENNVVIELSLHHDGAFDFSPVLTVNTAADNVGRTGNLFYYNPDSKTLEFVEASPVSETGDISFTFSHASDYAVVISDKSMQETGVISETVKNEPETAVPVMADTETDGTGDSGKKESSSLNPVAIVVIVVIIVICAGIGVTVYFLLGRRDKDEFYEEDENESEDEDSEEYLDELSVTPGSKDGIPGEADEYDENGTEDFIDDYREPEVKTKKTGKVISIAKKQQNSFENDEFDGFE